MLPCVSLPQLYHTTELFHLLVKIMSSLFRTFETVNQSLDSRHKEIPNLENMQVIFPKNSFISTLIDFFSPSIIHQETLATLFLLWDIANLQDEPCSQYHELDMHSRRAFSFYSTSGHDPDNATVSNFVLPSMMTQKTTVKHSSLGIYIRTDCNALT